MLTKRCLILQERQAGDAGRFLDILTKTEGVLEVFVRGSKKALLQHSHSPIPNSVWQRKTAGTMWKVLSRFIYFTGCGNI